MGLFKSRDDLFERLLKEKDKQITILAEEIDYLRLQLGIQTRRQSAAQNPSGQPPMTIGTVPYVSEDEEDVKDMLESGQITADQMAEILDGLGYANTEIHG